MNINSKYNKMIKFLLALLVVGVLLNGLVMVMSAINIGKWLGTLLLIVIILWISLLLYMIYKLSL